MVQQIERTIYVNFLLRILSIECFLGLKRVNNELVYAISFNDTQFTEEIASNDARLLWPQRLINFLEDHRIKWTEPVAENAGMETAECSEVIVGTEGEPEKISCNNNFFLFCVRMRCNCFLINRCYRCRR